APAVLRLDSAGRAVRTLGPLEADLFLRASSGGRESGERKVTVALPAFLAGLELVAHYPAYLARADEPLVPGDDTVPLPQGTEIATHGNASVPLAAAEWRGSGGATGLAVRGAEFSGHLMPRASGSWILALAPRDSDAIEGAPPELHLRVVPDSAPVVQVPVPGADTVLPLSLRAPLVVDARDDHGLTRLAIYSWRVSRTGKIGDTLRDTLPVAGAGDRAVVQTELALDQRGLLPGDTVRFFAEAWDNAPAPHAGKSPIFALRLQTLEELRAATRAETQAAAGAADSISAAQRELADKTRDLAAERVRGGSNPTPGTTPAPAPREGALPFQETQRAAEVARQQTELTQRVQALERQMADIARAAQAAGVYDTAFQARLAEVQQLLEKAISPELAQRLEELKEALARLDPDATRQALQRLADAQQQLKAELERSHELFQRAAVEGELATLAADAEDLHRRQQDWNQNQAPRADSAAARAERDLADRTARLEQALRQAGHDLDSASGTGATLGKPADAAHAAQSAMQRAAGSAEEGQPKPAGEAGEEAARELARLPQGLHGVADSVAASWRNEAVQELDRALVETAAMAERERAVADALRGGEGGAAIRARQASIQEGTDAIGRQLEAAAGKQALVSRGLQMSLGFAELQMASAREQLEQPVPNLSAAADLAGQALDGLNRTAYAIAQSRGQVAGSKSGSGLAEALEQLAQMARDQQGLNGTAQGLLPMMAPGAAMMDQLRALAAQQRKLADQLARIQAQGNEASDIAGQLAQEARDLARQLDAGHLDRQTIARQERLYRRLLDAGRTLSGDEPDESQPRVSRSAQNDSVHTPGVLLPGATGAGPKVPYPTWEALSGLTPEERRLVLDYFRRLNAAKP
ncbi:MAG TPA: hypothetical protein VFK78_13040, partial [Gemmatimonadales bacterium]|nr:hypothetical protein [Gemmatimonadales bacterium]